MKFECKFCRLQWDLSLDGSGFDEVQRIQLLQCPLTIRNVGHSLRALK